MNEKVNKTIAQIRSFVHSLSDVRKLGLMMFLVVVLMITWSGIRVIETNYHLQRSISQLQQENAVRQLENQNLELENQYFESEEYLELEARKNFGLAAEGETVVVVPKAVALNHTTAEPDLDVTERQAEEAKWRQNLNAWLDFLLHRGVQS